MVKGHGKEMNNQRGSATIEAVIGFTAFLFAIFAILGLVNFCRAQMLISSAVDTAAKEMSQYSYFYEMSGLKKFDETLKGNASVGKNNINEVVGTVTQFYGSINGAVAKTGQEVAKVENMVAAGERDLAMYENSIKDVGNTFSDVKVAAGNVGNAIGSIGNDPMLYMRSVVALIGSEGMEAAKRAVAIPLARAFVSRHFGANEEEVDASLKSLGIENGLSDLDFSLSNIFSDKEQENIEIVVVYKVKLFQIFDWVVMEAKLIKTAECRAWLAGDDVLIKATKETQPALETQPTTDGEATEPSEGTDGEGENPEGEETPEEPTTDKEQTNDPESIWNMPDEFYEGSTRDIEFHDVFKNSGLKLSPQNGWFSYEIDEEQKPTNRAYRVDNAVSADDIYFSYGMMLQEMQADIKHAKNNKYPLDDVHTATLIVYVPENISAEEINKIKEKFDASRREYTEHFNLVQTMGNEDQKLYMEEKYADAAIYLEIKPAGGTYDYSKGG